MSEKTKIIQYIIPPLVAGVYTVEVKQTINNKNTTEPPVDKFSKSLVFGVDAARFTLNAKDIYSVYPPANQFGNFSGTLPHVVFTRRTLPWERTIDGKPPVYLRSETPENAKTPKISQPVPWMALLLFDEDEMKNLQIVNNNIGNVLSSEKADITLPVIYAGKAPKNGVPNLMPWEYVEDGGCFTIVEDGCFTIDITKEQFENYIPTLDGLPYLAHAKEVNIDNKDKEGITDLTPEGTGVFSVIVGNRMPLKGKQYTAVLVSLEGFMSYLAPAAPTIPVGNKVRLVVLAHWSFNNSGDATFLQLVDGLEIKPLKIKKGMEDQTFASALSPYYDSGYVPMEHLTRNGATTVSWYHGPLVPGLSPKMSKSISFSSSDAALRYDKTTGFFDVSFAAAWQLGRMLGLQNQGFSKAIQRYSQKQNEVSSKHKELEEILGDASSRSIKDRVIRYIYGDYPVSNSTAVQAVPNSGDVPTDVQDFLGRLFRLNGVPFNYLVPHELLLEKEHTVKDSLSLGTLAFFYIDPNWIEAMLDGALSLGRVPNTDSLLDKAMRFVPEFTDALTSVSIPEKNSSNQVSGNQLNVTGFLLRSDLVSGWRGIEIKGFDVTDENTPPLKAFRLERIDNDIFLSIFNGNVLSVEITQPYEGLHFGLKISDGTYQMDLKKDDGSNNSTVNVNTKLNNGLINEDGVIDIAGLAKAMQQELVEATWMKEDDVFTSAEFAYQMIDLPVKRRITISVNGKKQQLQ